MTVISIHKSESAQILMSSKDGLSDILEKLSLCIRSVHHIFHGENETEQNELSLYSEKGADLNSQGRISALNKSLNTTERSPVLSAALSLLGYDGHKVWHEEINILVETFAAILDSTITCKVVSKLPLCFDQGQETIRENTYEISGIINERHRSVTMTRNSNHPSLYDPDFLCIGTCISITDFSNLFCACQYILENLQGYGDLFKLLIDAISRVAISVTPFETQFSPYSRFYKKHQREKLSLTELINFFSRKVGTLKNRFQIPLRLHVWRLHPHLLKEDMSIILHEALQRPLLCLKGEFCRNCSWHSMVVSFITAPDMFVEARSILHYWFLQTSIERVWELKTVFVSSVLDALLKPDSWGVASDVGIKLPSSHTLFCQKLHPLLSSLMGPITYKNLSLIVLILEEMQPLQTEDPASCLELGISNNIQSSRWCSFSSSKGLSDVFSLVDKNSAWALLLDFPAWFVFAAILLFRPDTVELSVGENEINNLDSTSFYENYLSQNIEKGSSRENFRCHVAAKFLAWVLSPSDSTHRSLVAVSLVEAAKAWNIWRSKLIMSKNGIACEMKANGKRNAAWIKSESSIDNNIRSKKARVDVKNSRYQEGFQFTQDDNDSCDSFQAVTKWLHDFSNQCHKLYTSTFISKNAEVNIRSGIDEGFGECKNVSRLGSNHFPPQELHTEAWNNQYAYLRRIPLGLLLSNVYLLCEQSRNLILYFITADENVVVTHSSCASTFHEDIKEQDGFHDAQHFGNGGKVDQTVSLNKEAIDETDSYKEFILRMYERNMNWVKVTSFILNIIDMLNSSCDLIENTGSCISQLKNMFSKFLVICTTQLLKRRNFDDITLLKDLQCRFSSLSQIDEDSFEDVLQLLDSRIASQKV